MEQQAKLEMGDTEFFLFEDRTVPITWEDKQFQRGRKSS
jgi:hypothetical protein